MQRAKTLSVTVAIAALITGCGSDDAPDARVVATTADKSATQTGAKPAAPPQVVDETVTKPLAPYSISYNVIGTPVIGSPVTVQLQMRSAIGPSAMMLEYSNRDASALVLGASQPSRVSVEVPDKDAVVRQQVSVVPQREGRHYLNVRAIVQTPNGDEATTMAIPIQVGEGGRELIEQGRLETTESGETVRVLPGN
ncbi:MAG: hypothetical protein AAFN50_05200 [Pseudomonadota bacterium]